MRTVYGATSIVIDYPDNRNAQECIQGKHYDDGREMRSFVGSRLSLQEIRTVRVFPSRVSVFRTIRASPLPLPVNRDASFYYLYNIVDCLTMTEWKSRVQRRLSNLLV